MAIPKTTDPVLNLPEGDYGAEVRAMTAVITQMKTLTVNLEALLFNLTVYSHKPQVLPPPVVVLEDGDLVEEEVPRLVRGSLHGICKPERIDDVLTATDEQEATTPSS